MVLPRRHDVGAAEPVILGEVCSGREQDGSGFRFGFFVVPGLARDAEDVVEQHVYGVRFVLSHQDAPQSLGASAGQFIWPA